MAWIRVHPNAKNIALSDDTVNEHIPVKCFLPGVRRPCTKVDNGPVLEMLAFKYFYTMKVPLTVTDCGGATEFQHGGWEDLASDFSHLFAQ
jgi:hypothetical protein